MLNEEDIKFANKYAEKIKIMTRLAFLEEENQNQLEISSSYYRHDYIAKYMIRAFFLFTLAYVFLMGILSLYSVKVILETVNIFNVVTMIKLSIISYFVGLISFEIITYRVYSQRYDDTIKIREKYIKDVLMLKKRYELLDKVKLLNKEK